jgi:hypothetical protein
MFWKYNNNAIRVGGQTQSKIATITNSSFHPGFVQHQWKFNTFLSCLVDGNYGNWSLNSLCSVTCDEGFGTWTRECNNPEPKYGGRNCSYLGEAVVYRPCLANPCPGK